jgi:hypothetical protein
MTFWLLIKGLRRGKWRRSPLRSFWFLFLLIGTWTLFLAWPFALGIGAWAWLIEVPWAVVIVGGEIALVREESRRDRAIEKFTEE